MAETSRFWNGTALGDASEAPYDAYTEFSQAMKEIAGVSEIGGGVAHGYLNMLAVTDVGGGNVQVATGAALVHGTWYSNSAPIIINIPTPVGATRYDSIILRKDWAAQTVRCIRGAGVEGAPSAPALVKTEGTTWDLKLAGVGITVGGVITVYDYRNWIVKPIFKRQGGSATIWATAGTNDYVPTVPQILCGVTTVKVLAGNVSAIVTVNFPGVAFRYAPIVQVTAKSASSNVAKTPAFACVTGVIFAAQFDVHVARYDYANTAADQDVDVHWTAIGERFYE